MEHIQSRFAVAADYTVGREVCYYNKLVQAIAAVDKHKLSTQCSRVTIYDSVKKRTVRIWNLHSGVLIEKQVRHTPKVRATRRKPQKIRLDYG